MRSVSIKPRAADAVPRAASAIRCFAATAGFAIEYGDGLGEDLVVLSNAAACGMVTTTGTNFDMVTTTAGTNFDSRYGGAGEVLR